MSGTVMVVCPACDGTGAGSAPMRGPTCAAGMCPECRSSGEITEAKRQRLLAVANEAAASAKLAAIVEYCRKQADEFNRTMPFSVRPEDLKVSARDILAIIREG